MGRRHQARVGVPFAALAFSAAVVACGSPSKVSEFDGEARFLAPYAAARAEQCDGRSFDLTLSNRPGYVIETLPPIYESAWHLRTCDGELHFLLDCSDNGDGKVCGAHDWPLPAAHDSDSEFPHEFAAVAELAPKCPLDLSCRQKLRRAVSVRCAYHAPYRCQTATRDLP
ncbi:MAG: hypothetical protein ABI461_06920 [Polyangiaceae bacterium]